MVTPLFIADPKRGGVPQVIPPVDARFLGNPSLEPESSENVSLGVIWQPDWLEGLRIGLDYTRIEKTDEIFLPSTQLVVDIEDALPGRVQRAPLEPNAPPEFTAGPIEAIDASYLNISASKVESYDMQVSYSWNTKSYGGINLYAIATYLSAAEQQTLPDSDSVDRVDFSDGPLKLRGNFGLDWTVGNWSASWNAQYYDSYLVFSSTASDDLRASSVRGQGSATIPSQTYHDMFIQYEFNESQQSWLTATKIQLNIQNIFDRSPPIVATPGVFGLGGYSQYGDPRQRRFMLSISKSF